MNTPGFKDLLRNPVHFAAFGFGSGLAPKAPGTMGTVMAVPLYLLLAQLPLLAYSAAVIVATVVGIYLCGRCSRDLDVEDHPGIVWDEFVGFWITMWAVPNHWLWILAGFCVFRVFDIFKPWPISWMDRTIKGGWGIMVDDICAGLAACFVLQMGLHLAPQLN